MDAAGCGHGAQRRGVEWRRYSAAIRQTQKPAGRRFLSRARDRSGIIAAYPAQLLERIARFPPEAGMRPNLEFLQLA